VQKIRIVTLPGGGNSGPDHWQTYWESRDRQIERVAQPDWNGGTRDQWVDALDRHVQASDLPVVVVAHSLGNIVLAHWAAIVPSSKVVGALLVAPADVDAGWGLESALYREFRPVPIRPLPFASILVASTDDPYLSLERAQELSAAWKSSLHVVGALGHIGSLSKLEYWEEGKGLLKQLIQHIVDNRN
jgi:uncharacterized protein